MNRSNQENSVRRAKYWRSAATAVLLGMSAALLLNSWKLRKEKIAEVTDSLRQVSLSLNGLSFSRMNSSLLTDSILSIVQSYYVDPERVDNHDLLRMAVESLPSIVPGSRAGSSSKGIWFQFGGTTKEFVVGPGLAYEELVDRLGQLGEQLEVGFAKLPVIDTKARHDSDSRNGIATVMNALLMSLDAHSNLLSQESYRELRQGTEGAFGGLGVLVGVRDSLLTVIKPLPRSPALRAGIQRNDKILNINGTNTFGSTLDQLVEHMRGDPGTNVNISLLKSSGEAPVDINLKREVIHVDSVAATEYRERGLNVLHLTIDSFASRTSREVLSAIKKAKRRTGSIDGLILDMRSNPGGLLDQAVQVADIFLKSGVIVLTRGRREEIEKAGKGYDEVDFPMVVLVNSDSASASEIVAGALQDHDRAIVIGQPTFGKGSVQTIFELPEERALKLTIARYYTPAGRSIQNVGIIPDVWLQPVYKDQTNENLFGSYRYKNEQFLRNHLKVSGGEQDPSALARVATIKGYYLNEKTSEDDPAFIDREKEVALAIIRKVKTIHGGKISSVEKRAMSWLGLAGPEVATITNKYSRDVSRWLLEKQKVLWSDQSSPAESQLLVEVEKSSFPEKVSPGMDIKVRWRAENPTSTVISRVSIFARSHQYGLDTKEILLGNLEPREVRTGTLTLTVPSSWDEDTLSVRVGGAVDAWPVFSPTQDLVSTVIPREVAKVTASLKLVEESGGVVQGTLESKERAKLEVDVFNDGTLEISQLDLNTHNLSGRQIKLLGRTISIDKLRVGEHRKFLFELKISDRLMSNSLNLGVSLSCRQLAQTEYVQTSIPAKPTPGLKNSGILLGH